MPSKSQLLYPNQQKALSDLGERLRLARLRRKISAETLAARSSISRMTLSRAESGSGAVTIGTYIRILSALRLLDDLALVAKDDKLGRKLQDSDLLGKKERRVRPHGRE